MTTLNDLRLLVANYVEVPTSYVWHRTWARTGAWWPDDEPETTFCGRRIRGYWHVHPPTHLSPTWYCKQCKYTEDMVMQP